MDFQLVELVQLWPVGLPAMAQILVPLFHEDPENSHPRSNAPVDGREVPLESWQPELNECIRSLYTCAHSRYAFNIIEIHRKHKRNESI